MFICSIVIPISLGGLRLALYTPEAIFGPVALRSGKNHVLSSLVLIMLIPFQSVILLFKMHYLELKLRNSPNNKILLSEKDKMTFYYRSFIKVELGLETIYQMVGLFLLFLGAYSDTQTYPKIGADSDIIFGFKIPKERAEHIFLILGCISLSFSFFSCVRSHLNGLSADREYFPLVSKIMAALYTTIAITKRVLVIVLFFTPPLGLFSLLKHWQAEQIKWHPDIIEQFVDDTGNIQFGDSLPIPWNQIDRWIRNVSEAPALNAGTSGFKVSSANPDYYLEPPHYSLYTVFTLKELLYLFIGLSFLHLFVILIIKWKFSFSFSGLNLEMIIHGFENLNITYNVKQWDSNGGSAADYKKRMICNRNEGLALILVSGIFGIFHLIPLCLLGTILKI